MTTDYERGFAAGVEAACVALPCEIRRAEGRCKSGGFMCESCAAVVQIREANLRPSPAPAPSPKEDAPVPLSECGLFPGHLGPCERSPASEAPPGVAEIAEVYRVTLPGAATGDVCEVCKGFGGLTSTGQVCPSCGGSGRSPGTGGGTT